MEDYITIIENDTCLSISTDLRDLIKWDQLQNPVDLLKYYPSVNLFLGAQSVDPIRDPLTGGSQTSTYVIKVF